MMGQGGFNNFNRGGFNNGFNRGGFNNFNRGGFNRGNFHNDFNRGTFNRGAFANGRGFVGGAHFRNGHFNNFNRFHNVGFGLWAGLPWAWGWGWGGGYPYYGYGYGGYPYYGYGYDSYYPYDYPYDAYSSSGILDDSTAGTSGVDVNVGGLIFDVTPDSAQLYIDGNPVGTVSQFAAANQQPLQLAPGRHHVEIRAAGYHTVSFDADVTAGQVIPYQGTLEQE
jgi:PEGA domain